MTNTERTSKTPRSATGLFALLGFLLRVTGSGAPETSNGSGASKAGGRLALSVLVIALGALAFTATPALAAPGHVFSSSFGKEGSGPGEFSDPTGVAVNNVTGDVYVVDKGNNRVEEFNAEGGFIAEFNGSGTAGVLSEPEEIAIDNSGRTAFEDPSVGDLYVTDHSVVDKFSASGAYLGQITGTCEKEGEVPPSCSEPSKFAPFATLAGVAVDPKGVVWVYQGLGQEGAHIDAFSDSQANAFLSSRESKASYEACPGLAVNSEDDLYVAHHCQNLDPWIAELHSSGEVFTLEGQSGQALGGETSLGEARKTGVAVDPSNNDVYLDAAPSEGEEEEGRHPKVKIQELTPEGTEIEAFGEAQLKPDRGGTALAVSYAPVSSGDVYVLDSTAGKVDIFALPKATAYAESFSFGGKGTGTEPGKFSEPLGIAVNDTTEDLYVVDKGNKRVEELSKAGAFIAEFAPPGGFNEPEHIAVDNCENVLSEPCSELEDPSVGDVYVTDQLPDQLPNQYEPYAVDKFSSTGTYLGQLRRCPEEEYADGLVIGCVPAGNPTAGFDYRLTGVAVGPEGNVWVGTNFAFGEGPIEFSDTEPPTLLGTSGSATPLGPAEGYIMDGVGALDPSTGALFVDRGSSIDRYASGEGFPAGRFEAFPSATSLKESQGIAVNPAGTVYATEHTADDVKTFEEYPLPQVLVGAVASLRPTSVTLEGSVNPEGASVSSCELEYGTTTSYGQIAPCEQGLGEGPGEIGKGTRPVPVAAKLSGLTSGVAYHYRLVASNAVGTHRGSDHVLTTLGPNVSEEQVTYVEVTTATLQATIDPIGGETSYHFEYDTSPYTSGAPHGTSLPAPGVSIGAGTSPVPVSVQAQGLRPGTAYYYRVVAEAEPLGAPETFDGPGKTFATPAAQGSEPPQNCPNEQRRAEQPFGLKLPDCRAYEMVSPVESKGQDATDSFVNSGPRAAVSGEAVTYASNGSFAEPKGETAENQFVSRRGPGGWSTQNITPLHDASKTETYPSYIAAVYTPELTEGIASTNAQLTSEAPAATVGAFGLYLADFANGSYQYLGNELYSENLPLPQGASTDLSHVVFLNSGDVSEWVNGKVKPVDVANDEKVMEASIGAHTFESFGEVYEHDVWHAVSADGSRVFFTSPGYVYRAGSNVFGPPGVLYVRANAEQEQSKLGAKEECTEPAEACTIDVSASRKTNGTGPNGTDPDGLQSARYWGASADGSKVFFTSKSELTDDAYTGPADNATNLYECELVEEEAGHKVPLECDLTDLTGKTTDVSGEGAAVQGVVQISEDGQYVYFVAKGALKGEHGEALRNASGAEPAAEADNLYVSHEGGAPAFIATLGAEDSPDWDNHGEAGGPEINTAAVNPRGTRLAFMSEQSLTGYDNRDANTGEPDDEIFLYEGSDSHPPTLVCASCNPSGARPVGSSSLSAARGDLPQYRPRSFAEDGALFFDSRDALVPHASDGRQNVYEYEDGHVYAISDVAGGFESFFLDASANGENVFFGTADQLLPEDTSNNVVVWDARVGGGFPVTIAPPSCDSGDSCKPPPTPQPGVFGAPSSATFSGPGNSPPPPPPAVVKPKSKPLTRAQKLAKALKVCAKDKMKSKRAKCQKQAKQKYGASKANKSAHTNRRASR